MAKTDQALKWAGIIAIIYLVANQAANAILARIFVGSPTIQLGTISLSGIEVTLKVPVSNNTPLPIPVDSLQATVNYGGQPLTDVYLNQSLQIAPNDTTILTFRAILDYAQLSQSVANIIDTQSWLQALTFKGFVTSAGVVFPFEETFSAGI